MDEFDKTTLNGLVVLILVTIFGLSMICATVITFLHYFPERKIYQMDHDQFEQIVQTIKEAKHA